MTVVVVVVMTLTRILEKYFTIFPLNITTGMVNSSLCLRPARCSPRVPRRPVLLVRSLGLVARQATRDTCSDGRRTRVVRRHVSRPARVGAARESDQHPE